MTDAEKILLKKCKEGDLESFERLIEKYQKTAYNIAYRMLGNEEDAKDVAQDALIKVYKSINNFKENSSFSTWLYRIVINTCKDSLRKNKVKVISLDKPIGDDESSGFIEIADSSNVPDSVYEKKDLNSKIQIAINRLPEQNKVVVVLRDVQGFSYEDISEAIKVPIGTVKSRINRGRKILKDILINEMDIITSKA